MLKSFILTQRPFAIFDPSNKEHRDLFFKFQKTHSWKHCPYQWTIEDDSTNLVHFISKKMIDYYMAQETKAKKSQGKPVLKIKDIKTRKKAQN